MGSNMFPIWGGHMVFTLFAAISCSFNTSNKNWLAQGRLQNHSSACWDAPSWMRQCYRFGKTKSSMSTKLVHRLLIKNKPLIAEPGSNREESPLHRFSLVLKGLNTWGQLPHQLRGTGPSDSCQKVLKIFCSYVNLHCPSCSQLGPSGQEMSINAGIVYHLGRIRLISFHKHSSLVSQY